MQGRGLALAMMVLAVGVTGEASASRRPTVWERIWRPEAVREQRVREDVERLLFEAELFGWDSPSTQDRLRLALLALSQIDVERATDVRVRFLFGRVLCLLGEWARGASVLEAVVEQAPEHPMANEARFRLAIAYAWLGARDREIAMYDAFLERATSPAMRATALSNRAEARMARGELHEAVNDYRAALAIEADPVSTLGLAVALDRLGDFGAALVEAERSLLLDPHAERLRGPNVFFVPAHERHWYEALFAMASARRAEDEAEAASHWRAAAAHLAAYVRATAPDDPWLPLARARQLACEKHAARARSSKLRR